MCDHLLRIKLLRIEWLSIKMLVKPKSYIENKSKNNEVHL